MAGPFRWLRIRRSGVHKLPERCLRWLFWNLININHIDPYINNSLGITSQTLFRFDPIVVTATKDVRTRNHFLKQIASVEVTISLPERDIRTILRLSQDNQFQQLLVRLLS